MQTFTEKLEDKLQQLQKQQLIDLLVSVAGNLTLPARSFLLYKVNKTLYLKQQYKDRIK